jgi:integrase
MKLTVKTVENLKHHPAKGPQQDVKDEDTRGLYLRIYRDTKVWVFRYRKAKKTSVMRLGTYPKMGLSEARAEAAAATSRLDEGGDPAAEAREAARKTNEAETLAKAEAARVPTVEAFAAEYIERHAKRHKRSWREDERLLKHDVNPVLGTMKLDEVHRRHVISLLDRIRDQGKLVLANRVLAVARKMFNFAVERGVLEYSPVTRIKATPETARERILSDEEIRKLWEATGPEARMTPATRLALRLLLLTGQREAEVCGMERSEVDLKDRLWTIPGTRVKNKMTHVVPLSDEAMAVIQEAVSLSWSEQWVFPAARGEGPLTGFAPDQAMGRIFADRDDRPTVHDVRRTVGTMLGKLGFNRLVQDRVLNHKDRTVGGIYDRHSYDREKRSALEAWARELTRITSGTAADNVVTLVR